MRWLTGRRAYVTLFAVGLAVYAGFAAERLRKQSGDPHFVYQADAWLHGRLATQKLPKGADDPARVETVLLKGGGEVRGRRLKSRRFFRTTTGDEIPIAQVERTLKTTEYVSFPPFPAVLMLPQVIVHDHWANDVFTTVLVGAAMLPLLLLLLRRLRDEGFSDRTDREHLWLIAAFAFGTSAFYSAVQGRVWFTAHTVGLALCLGYAACSIGARRPILAGVLLGCAALTRTPMAFMFPLFLLEAWRVFGKESGFRSFAVVVAKFAAPVVVLAVIGMLYNYARFDSPTEFGHSYLAVRQQAQIEAHGLFSLKYFARNLAVAFTLLPEFGGKHWISISGHGLAVWFTMPFLVLLLWPHKRGWMHRALWITVACVAVPSLFYQNSGWVQFGYRFLLDYAVFLIALLAIGGRPLDRVFKGLIVIAIVINIFGAVTFHRYHKIYKTDAATYGTIVRH